MGDIVRGLSEVQMPTRNISLTAEQDAFVAKIVEDGEYQNASEAIRDALRVLQQRRREDRLRLKSLRARVLHERMEPNRHLEGLPTEDDI